MKKIFLYAILLFICSGCDHIAQPFEELAPVTGGSEETPDTTVGVQKVLIEDFTGHTCGNCPEATDIAQQIKATYGERVVIAGIHAGYFAEPASLPPGKYSTDFRTTAGETYDKYFGVSLAGNPNGLINRSDTMNNNRIVSKDSWGAAVEKLLNRTPVLRIKITAPYDSLTNNLSISVEVKALAEMAGSYNLVLYMVEDSVVDWQKDYRQPVIKDVQNYVHRDVLREVLPSAWGEPVFIKSVAAGTTVTKNYAASMKSGWKAEHIHIIAYVYESSGREILQVDEIKLKK